MTQNEGKIVQAHLSASPAFMVTGKYCSTYTTMTSRPPDTKCKNSVVIYALMSDLNKKLVT